jgi:hypothetical protein
MMAILTIVLLMASISLIVMSAEAQLDHIGASDINAPNMPHLGPLPAGVTPDYTFQSHAYLSFRPNPIGVGQPLLINIWTSPGMYHAFYMQGYHLTIQKPDGTTDSYTTNSYVADATAWFEYVPTQVGTYSLKFESPGTYIPAGEYVDRPGFDPIPPYQGGIFGGGMYTLYASVYYTPDSTDWQNLTVQAEFVSSWPAIPLPTDYWTRPVNVVHRDWYPILGNYPFTTQYYFPNGRIFYANSYTTLRQLRYVIGPNTGHVVWKKDVSSGSAGMIGGSAYQYSVQSNPGSPDIIYNGRCYDSLTRVATVLVNGTYVDQPTTVWSCYDLRTGEVYWRQTGVSPIPNMIEYTAPSASTSVPGAEASGGYGVSLMAISGNRLAKYNPQTGAVTLNISIPSLSSTTYYMDNYALSVQNLGGGNYRLINWTTTGSTTNFTERIAPRTDSYAYMGTWNISWPKSGLDRLDVETGVSVYAWWSTPPGPQWCIGNILNVTDLNTGQILWSQNYNQTGSENIQGAGFTVVERGKIAFGGHGRQWACWNARTGQKLWDSEKTEYPWGAWWPYSTNTYDSPDGEKTYIIAATYEGIYAIDIDNGKIVWHYQDPNAVPFENPYTTSTGHAETPFFTAVTVADDKVYAYNGEHTASYPYARDWKIHCINATNGELLWKMINPMVPGAIADGYLTAANSYDGYMYVFGRGKSATTVTAPDVAVPLGTAFTIKGTVLDQSPGQPGTPCVSKDSMETQMEYIHLQMPITGLWNNESITGVPVYIYALDSNNNVIDIGTATTNGYYGTFSMAWTPPNEDTYTIIASFAADDSYGSSSAATAVTVGPAPEPIEFPPTAEPVDNTMLLYGILVTVIIAIVLALIAILLIFRKR